MVVPSSQHSERAPRCATPRCRNAARVAVRSLFCGSCNTRKWRERHPEKYAWQNLKHHAKQRGIAFSLTFEEFCAIVVPEGYLQGRGRTSTALQVDRIDPARGYEAGNVRVITTSENARLAWAAQHGVVLGDADEGDDVNAPIVWEEVA